MLSWFKHKERDDIYQPRERLIYTYWDGTKKRRVDPLWLYQRVTAVGPMLSTDIKVSQSASVKASEAHVKMVEKMRDIFQVKSLEEGGLTELECINLLDHFLRYCDRLKKKSKDTVIPATGTLPNSESSSTENQPIGNGSASGSTVNGNGIERQESSLTEVGLSKVQ